MAEKEKVDQIENEENLSSENISLEDNKDELSSSEQLDNSKEEKNEQSSETNSSKESELENKTQVGQIEGYEDSKKIEDDQESKKKKSHKKNRSQRKAKIDKEKTLAVTSASDAPEEVQQVLVSVSDEYLRKKKRKKIITLSSILSIVLILSIAIITLACVNINLKPFFIEPPSSYTIVIDGSERETMNTMNLLKFLKNLCKLIHYKRCLQEDLMDIKSKKEVLEKVCFIQTKQSQT